MNTRCRAFLLRHATRFRRLFLDLQGGTHIFLLKIYF